ncbi:MAG: DJ-1/PfpI family protein [Acidimicrobiia bacterium]|nr:DJ-1/PfpI family protein [Acidimicrobiia bacterium]
MRTRKPRPSSKSDPPTVGGTQIAIPIFDAFAALDAVGPYEVLQRLPGAEVVFVGHRTGPVRTENGFLAVTADAAFDDVAAPGLGVVPGGIGTRSCSMTDRSSAGSGSPPGWISRWRCGVPRRCRSRRRTDHGAGRLRPLAP